MREHNKRWLISMMKTSGSKRSRLLNGSYADERHIQQTQHLDELPAHESMKQTRKFYNNKINYGLLIRFLRGQVGKDWDVVYAEIISRIPTKLLDYRAMIFWFVADQVTFIDGKLWNKRSQKFIWDGSELPAVNYTGLKMSPEFMEFYVHPETNKLVRMEQKSFKRLADK